MIERQSNISKKNIKAATAWANDHDPEVAALAKLVVDIGRVHPGRRKRFRDIRRQDPELFQRMIVAGVAIERSDLPDPWQPSSEMDDTPAPYELLEGELPF